MASIARTYGPATANPVATGSTILAAHINTDLDTIYADYNGNITNANISASAAIAVSKTTLVTFTDWATWTPTLVGWSGSPTVTARWSRVGKLVYFYIIVTGTSDAVTTSFTLPATPSIGAQDLNLLSTRITDNGTSAAGPGMVSITNASTTATVYKDGTAGGSWTASGSKQIIAEGFFEVA